MIAQGNAMVQQMTEQRENNDLLGLGQQLTVAQQNQANGFNTLAQAGAGAMTAASAGLFNGLQFGGKNPSAIKVPGVNMNPIFNNPTFKSPNLSNIQIPKIG